MRRQLWLLGLLLAACTTNAKPLLDDFDASGLDMTKWTTAQIKPDQMRPVIPGRCTPRAIEIITLPTDSEGSDCPKDEPMCQRAEIRTAKQYWPKYGDEIWYAFSFRILGDIPRTGSSRTVIGQWKEPADDSPFLAQRFDNGVFHITVEDKGVRRVVALAEGNIDDVQSVQRKLNTIKSPAIVAQALREIRPLLQGKQSLLTDDTNVAKNLNVAPSKLVETLRPLAFVSEPEKYVGKADIELTSPLTPQLPDPSKGWIDLVYRILPGRTDNTVGPKRKAEIDIWANGTLVAEVRGNLGNPLTTEEQVNSGLYFKFGTYRARVPGTFRFQFDEFTQRSRPITELRPCPPT
ncbi:polysaccharide lyase-like protein [Rhizobium azibense]|nr:polysaccharide lyase-like protein [Rhizobium azibense]